MKQFYSLSRFPGKVGETNYTKFFNLNQVPYTYNALKCEDIAQEFDALKSKQAAGISISMPFKPAIIPLLDSHDKLVAQFNSCNTVVRDIYGRYVGYNTDYYGVAATIERLPLGPITILGHGSIGRMFSQLLGDRAVVCSRSTGNWDDRHSITGTVINCTSFGTSVYSSPFNTLPNVSCVVDLAIRDNELKNQCHTTATKYVAGIEFYRCQFKYQFELYTGIALTSEEINSI